MELEQCLDDEFSANARLFGLPDFKMAMQARESGVRRVNIMVMSRLPRQVFQLSFKRSRREYRWRKKSTP